MRSPPLYAFRHRLRFVLSVGVAGVPHLSSMAATDRKTAPAEGGTATVASWMVSKAASSVTEAREAGEAAAAKLAAAGLAFTRAVEAASSAFASIKDAEKAAVAAESAIFIVGVNGEGVVEKSRGSAANDFRLAEVNKWLKVGLKEAIETIEYFSKRLKEVVRGQQPANEAGSEEARKLVKVLVEVGRVSTSLNEASQNCRLHLDVPLDGARERNENVAVEEEKGSTTSGHAVEDAASA